MAFIFMHTEVFIPSIVPTRNIYKPAFSYWSQQIFNQWNYLCPCLVILKNFEEDKTKSQKWMSSLMTVFDIVESSTHTQKKNWFSKLCSWKSIKFY